MKFALIDRTRIAQIADAQFPVSPPLAWVSVADDTTTADSYVNGAVVKAGPILVMTAPTPLTVDDLYDMTIQTQRVLKGVVLALNDGSLPIAANLTAAQIKAIIKARM